MTFPRLVLIWSLAFVTSVALSVLVSYLFGGAVGNVFSFLFSFAYCGWAVLRGITLAEREAHAKA
jgi:hypothetical protein